MIEQIIRTPRIKDVFPTTESIFTKMNYSLLVDNGILDFMFYSDYGSKTISPIVENVLAGDTELSSEKITLLAQMLLARYKNSWDRQMAAAQAEYDPLHNYLDEYSESGSTTTDDITTDAKSETSHEDIVTSNSYTRTDNLSEGVTASASSSGSVGVDSARYGFNSAVAVPVSEDDQTSSDTSSNTSTTINTGTQTNAEARNEDWDLTRSESDRKVLDGESTHAKEGYHRGNIGNISTQKLLTEEIELWKWRFADTVLQDAAEFLALPLYDLYF